MKTGAENMRFCVRILCDLVYLCAKISKVFLFVTVLFVVASCSRPKTLKSEIRKVEIIDTVIEPEIGLGGATMAEIVSRLRYEYGIPVSFEEIDYSQLKNPITLRRALSILRELKEKKMLSGADKRRYDAFEFEEEILNRLKELRKKKRNQMNEDDRSFFDRYDKFYPTSETTDTRTLGNERPTYRLIENRITVEALLNRVASLDSNYEWRNEGTAESPIIVLQPKRTNGSSVLEKVVKGPCGDTKAGTGKVKLREIFTVDGWAGTTVKRLGLTLFDGLMPKHIGQAPEKVEPPSLGNMDLCNKELTLRNLLLAMIKESGQSYFYTVKQIGETRIVYIDRL